MRTAKTNSASSHHNSLRRHFTRPLLVLTVLLGLLTVSTFLLNADVPDQQSEQETTAGPAAGPLTVHPTNPRYFTDGSGRAVYLTGTHTWANFQDSGSSDPPEVFDYAGYLNFLESRNHNFIRLWAWEQAKWGGWHSGDMYFSPLMYERTGPGTAVDGKPKFDLTSFNQAYFDRLRTRVIQAGDKGIYVSIMLFDGWAIEYKD